MLVIAILRIEIPSPCHSESADGGRAGSGLVLLSLWSAAEIVNLSGSGPSELLILYLMFGPSEPRIRYFRKIAGGLILLRRVLNDQLVARVIFLLRMFSRPKCVTGVRSVNSQRTEDRLFSSFA